MSIAIWLYQNVDNYLNHIYAEELTVMNSIEILRIYKNTNEAITYLKEIRFDETIIIVSGKLFSELVEKINENLLGLYTILKIIVFRNTRASYLELKKVYENKTNNFYNFGGIAISFSRIGNFFN